MDEEYATMLGYTEEELEENFEEHLREHAVKMGKSYEDYRAHQIRSEGNRQPRSCERRGRCRGSCRQK